MMQKYKTMGFAFFLTLLVVGTALPAGAATVLENLENQLMCKCDDKCGKVIINCSCDTSEKTRRDFRKQLDSGLTVEQIVQMHVDKYGETVLSAPSKKGFNLTAWITPFAALIGGGLGVRAVIRSWLRRNRESQSSGTEAETPSADEPQLSTKRSSRLQDELDKLDS